VAVPCLGVRVSREVILDRRLSRKIKYNGKNKQQSEKEAEGTSLYSRTNAYTDSLYTAVSEAKKKKKKKSIPLFSLTFPPR